jgi:hypothetical protein
MRLLRVLVVCVLAAGLLTTAVATSGSSAATKRKSSCSKKKGKSRTRSAAKKKPKCKKPKHHAQLFNTTIKITGIEKFSPTTDVVKGQVSSPNSACLSEGVLLYKEAGAIDEKVNTDKEIISSPRDGTFSYYLFHGDGPSAAGQFYANIPGTVSKPRGIKCNGSTSPLFTAGDPSTTPTQPTGPSRPSRPGR